MMVIDTVHSSGVGRMHGGMKIARPFQAPEPKLVLAPGMVAEKGKGGGTGLDSNSRPGLVIRRRIMVRQADGFPGRVTPALSNQPNVAPTTVTVNHSRRKSMDPSPKQQCDITRSLSYTATTTTTTQDQSSPAMTKPAKTLQLFDLNKLPTVQENVFSPASSTPDSADSVTTDDHAAMTTRSSFYPVDTDVFFGSSPSMKKLSQDSEGGALAVDLGVLTPFAAENQQQFTFRKQVQAGDCNNSDVVPTPTRKRLRKLSEYADRGHFSSTTGSMAKSWTTGDGDGCNNRGDVTKTLPAASPSSRADANCKVRRRRRRPDVDDEVFSAVAALLMLSSSSARREFRFSSNGEASVDSRTDEDERRDLAAASDNEDPSSSLGSGSSVLFRPRNKQRYRSMAEIMEQTPILRRRVGNYLDRD